MVMQIRRTITPNNPPTGLLVGQLSCGMADSVPSLWIGVPTSIDPTGRRQINVASSVSNTAPSSPKTGDLWYDLSTNTMMVWNGSAWVPLGGGGAAVGDTPPSSPNEGNLWWDSTNNSLLVWTGSEWVETCCGGGRGGGGGGSSGPPFLGVTDGSVAAAGYVGEVLSQSNPFTVVLTGVGSRPAGDSWTGVTIITPALVLTPGDWLVYMDLTVTCTFTSEAAVPYVYGRVETGGFAGLPNIYEYMAGAPTPGPTTGFNGFIIGGNFILPQVSVSANTNAWFQFNTYLVGITSLVTPTGTGVVTARRMR